MNLNSNVNSKKIQSVSLVYKTKEKKDISFEITKLVKFSPKRDSHLRKIHEEEYYDDEDNSNFTTLRMFSETRWTVRASSLNSIYENYQELNQLWTGA